MDAIYNVFGCKIKLFHGVFFPLNYDMINTNNKIRNENPASTGSLAGSQRFFSTLHLSSTDMDVGWIHPWVGLGWVGLDWVGSKIFSFWWVGLVGLGLFTQMVIFCKPHDIYLSLT